MQPVFSGNASTLAGTPGEAGHVDGPPATAKFGFVMNGIARGVVKSRPYLFLADYGNQVIRMVDIGTGEVSTIVGYDVP